MTVYSKRGLQQTSKQARNGLQPKLRPTILCCVVFARDGEAMGSDDDDGDNVYVYVYVYVYMYSRMLALSLVLCIGEIKGRVIDMAFVLSVGTQF